MKVTAPLSLKISLWLLANLLLLATAGGAFYISQFGLGWNSLTRGALGEQLQSIGDSIARDLNSEPSGVRPTILSTRARKYGADFYLFRNDGIQVAGPAVELPTPVRDELSRGNLRGEEGPPGMRPPPRPGRGEGGPPPGEDRGPPGKRPPSGGRLPGEARLSEGRFVFRTGTPTATWFGLRLPIPNDFGRPVPGTIIIRASSLWSVGLLLHAGPWLAVAVGALVLSVLFWLPLIGSITRSLNRLTRATERIAEGHFDTRVALDRRDELGHLGVSVNRMAERLDTLVNGQKRFLGDVAHELGSPLGRLQVATEILETRADPALHEHVADVREEVQQMATLTNELLAFTKAGLRPRDAELQEVALPYLVHEALVREHAVSRVKVTIPPDLVVRADAALLGRAIGNLLRNAVRYTTPDDAIRVVAQRDGPCVLLAVEDEGPGVPPEALNRLGEPFYRPDSARSREAGGTGLGLAIVRSSLAACGGEVHFTNRTPRGFRAELRLNLAHS